MAPRPVRQPSWLPWPRSPLSERAYYGLLTVLALASYGLVAQRTDFGSRLDEIFLSQPDAREYAAVSDWLFGLGTDATALRFRPVLYPLWLGLKNLVGIPGVVLLQAGAWLASGLLLAAAVRARTGARSWATAAFVGFVVHPSPILHTFHGLTESLVILLLAAWVFWSSRGALLRGAGRRLVVGTVLLALLTITKPLYKIHLALFVGLAAVFWLRQRPRSWRTPVALAAGCVPVVLQLVLMWQLFDVLELSDGPARSFREFFVAQIYQHDQQIPSLADAREIVIDAPPAVGDLLARHPGAVLRTFLHNLWRENVGSPNALIWDMPHLSRIRVLSGWLNQALGGLHLLFACLLPWALRRELSAAVLATWVGAVIIVASSGLVFWGGDRLIVVALPLWLFAYTSVGATLWRQWKRPEPAAASPP